MSSIDELSLKLIRKLTSPSTSYHRIKFFAEHVGTELHPCITAEIVLKWWSVREGICPDNTFIKLFSQKYKRCTVAGLIMSPEIRDMQTW